MVQHPLQGPDLKNVVSKPRVLLAFQYIYGYIYIHCTSTQCLDNLDYYLEDIFQAYLAREKNSEELFQFLLSLAAINCDNSFIA